MTPNRVTPRQSRRMPLRRAERFASTTFAPEEDQAVPGAEVRCAGAHQLEAQPRGEVPRVGPVALDVAAVGEVQDQEVAARPGHAGHLAELDSGEIGATRLVEVGE